MTLEANQFSYAGFTAGNMADDGVDLYTLVASGEQLNGLQSPPRRTSLNDRQGHGQELGSQWATGRTISATVWTEDIATVVAFDATFAPRPDPTDLVPWVGNFLGLGERLMWVVPMTCDWSFDSLASVNMWKMVCTWFAPDPTIYSATESDLSWGGGGSPVAYTDLTVTNDGTSTPDIGAWTLRVQAHGTCTDPYIQIQGDSDRAGEAIRFTGLTMTSGQVLRIDRRGYATVGTRSVDGYMRTRGQRLVTFPTLQPGAQTVRVGMVTGSCSGNFHHRSTWSV